MVKAVIMAMSNHGKSDDYEDCGVSVVSWLFPKSQYRRIVNLS